MAIILVIIHDAVSLGAEASLSISHLSDVTFLARISNSTLSVLFVSSHLTAFSSATLLAFVVFKSTISSRAILSSPESVLTESLLALDSTVSEKFTCSDSTISECSYS